MYAVRDCSDAVLICLYAGSLFRILVKYLSENFRTMTTGIKHTALCIYALMTKAMIAQVTVPNAGFEKKDNSSPASAQHWNVKGSGLSCTIDSIKPFEGKYSMKLSSPEESGGGSFEQDMPFTCKGARMYKIKCAIRAKGLVGKVGVGARIFDKEGTTITGYRAITVSKDQDWTRAEGVFFSDESADKIRIFSHINGKGEAWIDDIVIEEVRPSTLKPSKQVSDYMNSYFGIVEKHTIVKNKALLATIKKNCLQLSAGFTTLGECHELLKRYAAIKLNDGHSFFATPEDWRVFTEDGNLGGQQVLNLPSGKMLPGNIAYLEIPMFASFDEKVIASYVDSIQTLIKVMDAQNPKGWVIDISKNGGGHSFAMLAGIGPLVGDGICGYSYSGDGSKRTRIHKNGWTGWDSDVSVQKANPYQLRYSNKPIAVIYGNRTGSAGECVAIDFIGLANTKSFGQPTSGATTRVDNYDMGDGAYMNLAAGVNADRTGKAYGGKLYPEVETPDTETAIEKAREWILSK